MILTFNDIFKCFYFINLIVIPTKVGIYYITNIYKLFYAIDPCFILPFGFLLEFIPLRFPLPRE